MEHSKLETLEEADEMLTEFAEEMAVINPELSAAVVWARNHSQPEEDRLGNYSDWESGELPFENDEDEATFAAGMMVGSILHSKKRIFDEQQDES